MWVAPTDSRYQPNSQHHAWSQSGSSSPGLEFLPCAHDELEKIRQRCEEVGTGGTVLGTERRHEQDLPVARSTRRPAHTRQTARLVQPPWIVRPRERSCTGLSSHGPPTSHVGEPRAWGTRPLALHGVDSPRQSHRTPAMADRGRTVMLPAGQSDMPATRTRRTAATFVPCPQGTNSISEAGGAPALSKPLSNVRITAIQRLPSNSSNSSVVERCRLSAALGKPCPESSDAGHWSREPRAWAPASPVIQGPVRIISTKRCHACSDRAGFRERAPPHSVTFCVVAPCWVVAQTRCTVSPTPNTGIARRK